VKYITSKCYETLENNNIGILNNNKGKMMSHTNKFIRLSAKAFLLSMGLTLVACGGGGGGSPYPNIQYTGAVTEATITDANASDFPVVMLEGSSSSSNANPFAAAIDNNATQSAQHTAMLNILAEQIKNDILIQQQNSDNNLVSATSHSTPGTCPTNPGSTTITDNSTSTNLSGSFTYDNYCVGDISFGNEIVLHGKINYSGSLFLSGNDPIFQSMAISVEYLKLTVRTSTETFSEEFSGSMTITFDGTISNKIVDMTVTTNFQVNGLTYKIVNLKIDTLSGLNINGRFYHPTHGYVDFTTTTNFTLVLGSNPEKYCSGALRLEGSGGDVIDFTASPNCTTYEVCVTPFGGTPSCQTGLAWP